MPASQKLPRATINFMKNQILLGGIVTVVVVGGLSGCAENLSVPGSSSSQNPAGNQSSELSKTDKLAELEPSIIGVVLGAGLAEDGTISRPLTAFAPTTASIYAVLSLKNVSAQTQLSYIRYYEGKYVDTKVSHPSKDGAKYFHFEWSLKDGKLHKVGNYTLDFYLNGKKFQTVSYTVK
jgi:hypothetical protein